MSGNVSSVRTRKPRVVPLTAILFGFIMTVGCGGNRPQIVVTDADCEVFEAVLTDMLTQDEYICFPGLKSNKKILLADRAAPAPHQLTKDSTTYLGKRISPELMGDIVKRTPKKTFPSLKQYTPKNPNILVRDLSNLTGEDWEYGFSDTVAAGARGFVGMSLPGFSRDGQTAFCCFISGPSNHGAAGFCVLKKEDGRWKVIEWHVAFFT